MAGQNAKPVGRGPRRGMPAPKIEHPWQTFMRVFHYIMKNYALACAAVLVLIVINVLASVQGTLFMQTLIDDYITPLLASENPDFSGLAHAITRVAIFYLCGVGAAWGYNRIMVNVGQGTLNRLRNDMFSHMEGLSIGYFDTHSHGDIMSMYTNDVDTLRQMISQSMPSLIQCVITIVSVFLSMIYLSVPLTILTIVMTSLIVLVTKKAVGLSGKFFIKQQIDLGALNGYIEEMMTGQKVVKVFCYEDEAIEKFEVLNEELCDSAYKANRYANILGPINAQLGNVSYVVCAIVGGVMAIGGYWGLTLGDLASFLTFNKSFSRPISEVSSQFNSIVMALAGADRIFKMLDEKPEVDEGTVTLCRVNTYPDGSVTESKVRTGHWAWKKTAENGSSELIPMKGDVKFKDVDFSYVPEKQILHDINLYGLPGQKIAFVGSTGAGKTTVINLISRFYDVSEGRILFDGIDVKDIRKYDLRLALGIVLQDTHLFTGTVMENIRYGKMEAQDFDVIQAAKLVGADGFIRRLPEGYNTVLKGDGSNLSQGQRQLLAIARAAVADPPVLILDEATSSIDTRTEKIVQEGMDSLMKGRTTFVIAHRLSTIRNSDCILVMEQGRIIERGNHDELIGQGGRYYQLYTGKVINS